MGGPYRTPAGQLIQMLEVVTITLLLQESFSVGGSLGLGLGGPADYSLSTPAPAQWSGVPVLAKTGEIRSKYREQRL